VFGSPQVEGDTNIHGRLSFVIRSAVADLAAMHSGWGRLPLKEVAAPAMALARRGLQQNCFTTPKIVV
jgi:gamma-glutamyltranspeptidase/glutathione hydrolase